MDKSKIKKSRPYVISIAGFDPSGGAGVLADIKTFEAHKVMGLGVLSSITFQTEDKFLGVDFLKLEEIKKQLEPLLNQYPVNGVKVGLIKDLEVGFELFSYIKRRFPQAIIVWDPVLKATAGFEFWKVDVEEELLWKCLNQVDVFTPNKPEFEQLFGLQDQDHAMERISQNCHLVLKGGHNEEKKGYDVLVFKDSMRKLSYRPKKLSMFDKHGSGCVFSASLLANLTLGIGIHQSMLRTKRYMDKFFWSSETLLGKHKY